MALEQGRRRNWFNDAKEVDFLKELNKLGAWQVINNILKLLSTQDLCRQAIVITFTSFDFLSQNMRGVQNLERNLSL